MTALAASRKCDKFDLDDVAFPRAVNYPVKGSTTVFGGSMGAVDASGRVVPASASSALKIVGKIPTDVVNSGADGAKRSDIELGAFYFNTPSSGADQILAANVQQICFAIDDNTVGLTDGGGTRPYAGIIMDVRADGQVAVFLGAPSAYVPNPETAGGGASAGAMPTLKVRSVVTANVASLAAFAGVTGGSSTNSDGVLAVQGDLVLLTAQTTPAQNGVYIVGVVSGGVAPLTRPDSFPAASTQPSGFTVKVGGEGALYKNTTWRAMVAASTFVVDTTDPKFFPEFVSWSCALVAGTMTAGAGATAGAPATMPVFSTNSKLFITRRTANTTASTIAYALNGTPTAGAPGTGAISGMATVAAGTINAADISTCDFLLDNQL